MIKFFHKSRLIALSLLLLSGILTDCKTPQEEKGEYFGYTKQTEENNVAGEYSDGLAYYVSRDHKEAAVGYGDCKDTDVVLPSTYRGIPITGIIGPRSQAQSIDSNVADDAFAGSSITSISFGNAVTSIGAQAFLKTPLTSVEIPAGVTELKTGTFEECTALTNLTFARDSQLQKIGDHCFAGDRNLQGGSSLTFPDSLESIGHSAFTRCTSFTSILFPSKNFTTIGAAAFAYCSSLAQIFFSSSIESIGDYAFLGLPDGTGGGYGATVAQGRAALALGDSHFNRETEDGSDGLWNILSNGVYLNMEWAKGDAKLANDFLYTQAPNGDITIIRYQPNNPPSGDNKIRVYLPESFGENTRVTNISDSAWDNYAKNIEMIALPKTLKELPDGALKNKGNFHSTLHAIFVPPDDFDWTKDGDWTAFEGKIDLSRSTSLSKIGNKCFGGDAEGRPWANITSVALPKTLKSIGQFAFAGFHNVTSLTFDDPYSGESPYYSTPTNWNQQKNQLMPCYQGAFKNMGKNATTGTTLKLPSNIDLWDRTKGEHFANCNFIGDLVFQERFYYKNSSNNPTDPYDAVLTDTDERYFQIPKSCFYGCKNIRSITTLNSAGTAETGYSFPSRVHIEDTAFANIGITWSGSKPITSNKYPGLRRIFFGPDYHHTRIAANAFVGNAGMTVYIDGEQANNHTLNATRTFTLSSGNNTERIDGVEVAMPLYEDVRYLGDDAPTTDHRYLLQTTYEGCKYDFITDKTKDPNNYWNVTLTRFYYDSTSENPPTSAKVPETFTLNGETFKVTKIGDNAFYRCCRYEYIKDNYESTKANTGISVVQLPNSITEIGSCAFAFTETLTRITTDATDNDNFNLPSNLTRIGSRSFFYTALSKVKLNAGLTTLATGDDRYGNSLMGATDNALTYTENNEENSQQTINTIYDVSGNTHFLKANDGVIYEYKETADGKDVYKAIGYDANGQGDNATVNIGIGLGEGKICDEVAPRAFAQQRNIATVVFAKTVTTIGRAAFKPVVRSNAEFETSNVIDASITSVSWEEEPDDPVTFGEMAFAKCMKMTSFVLPKTATNIPDYCFYDARMCVWDNHAFQFVKTIGSNAFAMRDDKASGGPTNLDLSSATVIGESAFSNCVNVKTIDFGNRTKSATGIANDNSGGVQLNNNSFAKCLNKTGDDEKVFIPKDSRAVGMPFSGCGMLNAIYHCEFDILSGGRSWSTDYNKTSGSRTIKTSLYCSDGTIPGDYQGKAWWYDGGTAFRELRE